MSEARLDARWPLACFAAMGIFWGTWAALLPDIRVQVGADDGQLGFALLGAGIGALPAMVVTGRLWPRLGWWLMPITTGFFVVSALLPIFVTTPLTLALALVAIGASSGSMDVSMNSAVSDIEVATRRRLMYGAHALFSLAVLVGSIATGLIRQTGGGPGQALPLAAVALLVAAMGSATAARSHTSILPVADPAASENQDIRLPTSVLPLITALAVLCAVSFLIEDALQNWSALLMERELDASPALGSAAPGIFAAAMFVGRSSGQILGGRFGERSLLVGGAVLSAIGLVITALAPVAAVALVGFAAAGAGIALVAPALFARAGRLAKPSQRGAAIARLTTFGYTGFLVGPVLVGLISQAAGLRVALASLSLLALGLAVGGAVVLGDRAGRFSHGEELLRTSRG